jgi:hypothetical protein
LDAFTSVMPDGRLELREGYAEVGDVREGDSYLGSELAEPGRDDVPNLDRVERLADATHWVYHDEAERVNELLIDFFAPARSTQNRQTT